MTRKSKIIISKETVKQEVKKIEDRFPNLEFHWIEKFEDMDLEEYQTLIKEIGVFEKSLNKKNRGN